jgi:thiosulfate dehydrogenase
MKQKYSASLMLAGLTMVLLAILTACARQTATPAATTEMVQVPPASPTLPPPAPTATHAPAPTPTEVPQLSGDLVRGGLLYDKWWEELGIDAPSEDHPLWKLQTTNTRSGADTWRCKECHGWDYRGVEGAYGSGSHKTGFKGVLQVSGKPAVEILGMLKGSTNPDHDFSGVMDEQALIDLALFLSEGMIDQTQLVNPDLTSKGNATQGKEKYQEVCVKCHGPEGNAINFESIEEPEFIAHIAADNPWEFIHKVRFGAPGWPMPSSIKNEWSDQDVANVLAYAQGFNEEAMLHGGGLLYDKWWEALGMEAPGGDHPLWKLQTTNTRSGADTWRCKECHGWDYKGVDGAYGSGSHKTGFKGVLAAASMSADDLTAWLTGGKNPDHNFSQVMDESAIQALVIFLQKEMADISSYVNADGTVQGDPAKGKTMFEDTCAACHGKDGKDINFGDADEPEYVGTVAAENPWEFFHKASFGQPGAPMPAGASLGWSMQERADLLAYAQTLPTK